MSEPKKNYIHDLRNVRSTRAVYGVGLAMTGSLAVEALIKVRTAPEIIHKPMRITSFNSKKINRVSAGFGFSLFASSSALYGSGLNNFYQLGGAIRNSNSKSNDEWFISPKRILLPENCGKILDISSGRLHSLIATSSALYSLGDNSHGQCGLDPETFPFVTHTKKLNWTPVKIPSNSPIKNVHCTLDSSFVLLENGEIYSFGLGTDGQLGNENDEICFTPSLVEGDLKNEKIVKISGSTDTLLAVSSSGDLFAWGQNEYGQISAVSDEPQVFYPRYLPFKNVGKIIGVAATGSSCIFFNSEGNVFTWGSIILGLGPKMLDLKRPMHINSNLFSSASGDEGEVEWVGASNTAIGVITKARHLFTFGANRHGNLGIGHANHQYFPYQVFLPEPIKYASFGPDHSLFVTH